MKVTQATSSLLSSYLPITHANGESSQVILAIFGPSKYLSQDSGQSMVKSMQIYMYYTVKKPL